jgi:hypothetical protein
MFMLELIMRLRRQCPSLERRVGGTASFEAATSQEQSGVYNVPHAFVVPLEETAADAQGNVTGQMVRYSFVVIVCVSNRQNRKDGEGLTAVHQLDAIRRELMGAFINWEPQSWSVPQPNILEGYEDLVPNSRADTVRFRGSSHVTFNDGRLWHQYEWSINFMEGALGTGAIERRTTTVTVTGDTAVVVDQNLPTSGTAVVTTVTIPNPPAELEGLLGINNTVPPRLYTFDPQTGVIDFRNFLPMDGVEIVVTYVVDEPRYWELLRDLYHEYYPDLLAKAGGDPNAILPDYYQLVHELPLDATVPTSHNEEPEWQHQTPSEWHGPELDE